MGAIYKGRDRLEDISSLENLKEDMDAMVAGGGRQLTRVTDTERMDWLAKADEFDYLWSMSAFDVPIEGMGRDEEKTLRDAIDAAMASDEQDNREGGDEICPTTDSDTTGDSEPAPGLKLPTKNIWKKIAKNITREDCLEAADATLALLDKHQPSSVRFYAHRLKLMRERAEKADARVRELSHELERYSAFQYEQYMEELKQAQDLAEELEKQRQSAHDVIEMLSEYRDDPLKQSLADTLKRVAEAEALLSRTDGLLAGELKADIDAFMGKEE